MRLTGLGPVGVERGEPDVCDGQDVLDVLDEVGIDGAGPARRRVAEVGR